MNDEQINEVMRLADVIENLAWSAGKTEQYNDNPVDCAEKLPAARAELETYLRTIGEPENTFPLNPNAASKWAHLQKHDGAEAVGVVFRTGSGSVGSLVDGRVVWADWLAHPNGSKPADSEYTDEDMAAVGRALMSAIAQYAPKGWSPADCPSELVSDLHNECEELRSDAERYRKLRDEDAWGEDTAPDGGSAWALLGELHGSEFDAFVDSRAESAIETPAKVSPCAGHAVQQEADASRDWPEDFPHENGQYMNTCHVCKNTFIGHKHRVVCKVCKVRNNGFIRAQQEADEAGGA